MGGLVIISMSWTQTQYDMLYDWWQSLAPATIHSYYHPSGTRWGIKIWDYPRVGDFPTFSAAADLLTNSSMTMENGSIRYWDKVASNEWRGALDENGKQMLEAWELGEVYQIYEYQKLVGSQKYTYYGVGKGTPLVLVVDGYINKQETVSFIKGWEHELDPIPYKGYNIRHIIYLNESSWEAWRGAEKYLVNGVEFPTLVEAQAYIDGPGQYYLLAVEVYGSGTTTPASTQSYPEGTAVTLTATPSAGYVTQEALLDGSPVSLPYTLTMYADHSFTVRFASDDPDTHVLEVSSNEGGVTTPPTGSYVYEEGDTVTVTAIPGQGFLFAYWVVSGSYQLYDNPAQLLMDVDKTLYAVFQPEPNGHQMPGYVVYKPGEPDWYDEETGQWYSAENSGDTRSAELLAINLGYQLLPLTAEESDPSYVPPGDLYPGSDLVIVGGGSANCYTRYYFPEVTSEAVCGSPRQAVTKTKKRNGDTLTLVAGCWEHHTWEEANRFFRSSIIPLVLPLTLIALGAWLIGKSRN